MMQMTSDDSLDSRRRDAVWRMLGLATRAGKVQTGAEAAEMALRRKNARLVIVAEDAAANTADKIKGLCRRYAVESRRFGSKSEIGRWTGHEERAVAVVLEPGFARRIEELIDQTGTVQTTNET